MPRPAQCGCCVSMEAEAEEEKAQLVQQDDILAGVIETQDLQLALAGSVQR